jgi:hypothetical protein
MKPPVFLDGARRHPALPFAPRNLVETGTTIWHYRPLSLAWEHGARAVTRVRNFRGMPGSDGAGDGDGT